MQRDILEQTLCDIATSRLPFEACGFVRSDGKIIVMTNVAVDGYHYFMMNPVKVLEEHAAADNCGLYLAAVWHSHPAGEAWLSERDKRMLVPNMKNVLVAGEDVLVYDGFGERLNASLSEAIGLA